MDGPAETPEASVLVPETRSPATPPNRPSLRGVLWPGAVVVFAAAGFALLGVVEDRAQSHQVLRDALVAQGGACPWDGSITCSIRPIPEPPGPALRRIERVWKLIQASDLALLANSTFDESVVAATLPPEMWQSLVKSGRAPVPGQAEALAGALCRRDHFTFDGVEFTVVGKLQRGSSCLAFAYLVPASATINRLFEKENGGEEGWIHPKGLTLARDADSG